MTIYRRMEENDCQAVEALFQDCFSHPWKKEAIGNTLLMEDYVSLVAETDGQIVGYIGYRSALDEADITNVAVSPDQRRKGIGRQLLNTLLETAADTGISNLYLEVRVSNEAAVNLYERAGFRVCGQRKNYYAEPEEDAWLMRYTDNT